jgi:hypothetical protein
MQRQIVKVYGEAAVNEGNVSKWYWLLEAGWTMGNGTLPPVCACVCTHTHTYVTRTVKVENFGASSIHLNLHEVLITGFSTSSGS